MQAVVIHAPKDLRIDSFPDPAPGANEVRVKIAAGGICGSDLHYYHHGGFGTVRIQQPMALGHEIAGVIAAVGSGVSHLKPGVRVAVNPSQPCGICLHMAESAIKDGFLYRCSSGLKSIGIYRDRVEYAGPAWLGLTFTQVALAPAEITGVAFPTPAELVLDSRQGRFKFAFPRPAQAAVARVALERLGWKFG